MTEHHQIVADGRQRLRGTEQHRLRERGVREAVVRRYEPEFEAAGLARYLILQVKMWRELRRELDTLTSERSLYLNPPLKKPIGMGKALRSGWEASGL